MSMITSTIMQTTNIISYDCFKNVYQNNMIFNESHAKVEYSRL